MSYSRFSSDDWTSDFYIYEDVSGGWTTHIGRHWVWDVELPPDVDYSPENFYEWYARYRTVLGMVHEPENGHFDETLPDPGGDYFNHTTPGECADNVERIVALGYHVPDGVIANLRAEQEALDAGAPRP